MATPSPTPPAVRPDKELLTGWLLLLLEGGATYGYKLRGELDAQRLDIDPGTVYRVLRKLERDGLVQSRWMGSVAGPRRRFYRLTAKGRRLLDDIAGLVRAVRDSHDAFVNAYEATSADRARATAGVGDEPAGESPAAEAAPDRAAAETAPEGPVEEAALEEPVDEPAGEAPAAP